jgi:selenocysteine lyase/cysteine desulfurase
MTLDFAAFRAAYSAFLRNDRVLLTGHSHQAWPDVARAAQEAYFDDSARFVDDKWGEAIFPKLDSITRRILARMDLPDTDALAFGKSTHELVFRLLTCLTWSKRPRVITTTSEFHSLHRQLSRLAEEGVEVVWVDASDRETLAARLIEAIGSRADMVALSAVLFEDSHVVRDLGAVLARAVDVGAIPLVDAYHAFNVVPFDLGPARDHVFVVAGGYKYAQFGEGVCWLRAPKDSTLRPIYTGWFADFGALEGARSHEVGYGPGGQRFSGATFDASGVYRADAALAHFDRFGLDVSALRALSTAHTGRLLELLDRRGVLAKTRLMSSTDPARRAGFVALHTPHADALVRALRARGVFTDARADVLRLGPAPYSTESELERGVEHLAEALHDVSK